MFNLGLLPAPWQQCIHPDGKPYSRHLEWNLVTEVNIRDPAICAAIQSIHTRISDWKNKISLPDSAKPSGRAELYGVLEPGEPSKGNYYYADHDARQVFWLEDVVLGDTMPRDVPPDSSFGTAPHTYQYSSYHQCLLQNYPFCETIIAILKISHAATNCRTMPLIFFANL
jgi:hypothetical protein